MSGSLMNNGGGDCLCHFRAYGDCDCGKDYRNPEVDLPQRRTAMTWTPTTILPCDHRDDTAPPVLVPPLRLLRALSGPAAPPPVTVDFITLADVADRVEWV